MKRWFRCILICLFLGGVTTVAVAWGCVFQLRGPLSALRSPPYPNPNDLILKHTEYDPDELWIWYDLEALSGEAPGAFVETVRCIPTMVFSPDPSADNVSLTVRRTGWPMFALEGTLRRINLGDPDTARDEFVSASDVWPTDEPYNELSLFLPVGILPVGFVVDTFFYAVLWLMLIGGVRFGRRRLRRKPGCCSRCGYDLRGLTGDPPRCPECGALDDSLDPG